ncbi:hypothetical protein TI03_05065, partial [Achromatium sp. WMS1]
IYILPTLSGMTFGLACALMLLGSLNYSSNIGLAFASLFGGVAIASMVHTWRNLLDLCIEVGNAPPIFLGQVATFKVHLSELRGLERAALIVNHANAKNDSNVHVVDLAASSDTLTKVTVIPTERGLYKLGSLRVASTFPLGLFYAWAYAETIATTVVYPTPTISQKWQPSIHFVPALQGGSRGVGVEDFVGLRPYRIGDSLKQLDWKALARGRGPVTRQFGGDRKEEIWLDWKSVGPGTIEERLSRLCRLILDASALDLSYGLHLPTSNLPPAFGDTHKHRCLTALALFQAPVEEVVK